MCWTTPILWLLFFSICSERFLHLLNCLVGKPLSAQRTCLNRRIFRRSHRSRRWAPSQLCAACWRRRLLLWDEFIRAAGYWRHDRKAHPDGCVGISVRYGCVGVSVEGLVLKSPPKIVSAQCSAHNLIICIKQKCPQHER